MNINNKAFGDIIYHLQECVRCACKNKHQCGVCSHKRTKLDYKYYERK